MTSEQIDSAKDIAREVFLPVEEYLLRDIVRRAAKAGEITSTAKYRIYRAAALKASKRDLEAALQEYVPEMQKDVAWLFDRIAENEALRADSSIQQMADSYTNMANKGLMDILKGKLGAVTLTGEVVPLDKVYQDTMDYTFRKVVTGAEDHNTALRKAVKKLAGRGICRIFTGKRSMTIEYAARLQLQNYLGGMVEDITRKNYEKLDATGWEISAHEACAEDHVFCQGRQYTDKEYQELNKKLVRPIGKLHCTHFAIPIRLGSNSRQYSDEQLAAMEQRNQEGVSYQGRHMTLYEATQEQRDIESDIREARRQILVETELGDAKSLLKEQIRLRRLQDEYVRFSKTVGLPTQNERLQVAGFGRRESALARAAYSRLTS